MKKNILIFPCGSEVALEIHRSLKFSRHFELFGGSSVSDHGNFVYEKFIGDIPQHNHPNFIKKFQSIITENKIDAVYPAMDQVSVTLKRAETQLKTIVIGSALEINEICASKSATYQKLLSNIPIPYFEFDLNKIQIFPIFIKPDEGYGSRNTFLANNREEAANFLNKHPGKLMLLMEYLPGEEWTVDCFSDKNGNLLTMNPRVRSRIVNGISVNTSFSNINNDIFHEWANRINNILRPRGAWFFQAKLDKHGNFKLLEVATRLAGSSGALRAKGINLALLSIFDAFNFDVKILPNNYSVEMDRALTARYKLGISFNRIYVDLDDCILIEDQVNHSLVGYLYKAINEGKKISLITRHRQNLMKTLIKFRLQNLFDEIIHLKNDEKKSDYICENDAIFIDDSFIERQDIQNKLNIPAFSPDMIDALM